MHVEIRFYSKSGNTKKIAEAIAAQAGVPAQTLSEPVQGAVDILFLGTGVYAFDIDPELKQYIQTLSPENIQKVVVFSTASLVKSAYNKTRGYLINQGLNVSDQEYHCPGHFKFLRKGRPNARDIENAGRFARSILDGYPADKE